MSLTWKETIPGRVWRSVDGRYAIVAYTLPENPPRIRYQARKIDPAMARAYPDSNTLGYLLEESPWCWNTENSAGSAEAAIDRDVFTSSHSMSVPDDHPAVALKPFYWPISKGTAQGALAVQWEGNELVARILGVSRRTGDTTEVAPWTEINLTQLGLRPRWGRRPATTTLHPELCSNCRVMPGEPHTKDCEKAHCLVTGRQRLLCTYFGASPVAGIEAITTRKGDEFEQYFHAPVEHDCGQDTWQPEYARS